MGFIKKKESVTFNFFGANFLSCQSGYKNQPVILIVTGSEITCMKLNWKYIFTSVIYSYSR